MGPHQFHQLSEPGMPFYPCMRMVSAGRGICASFVAGWSKRTEENRCQDREIAITTRSLMSVKP